MPAIRVTPPRIINFRDGYFTGASGTGGITPPGSLTDYDPGSFYWSIPPITPRTAPHAAPPINRRIVYVNGIQTFAQSHANTVKLISVVTGANVCGVFNMSGDGHEVIISKNVEVVLSTIRPEYGILAKGVNFAHTVQGFLTDLGQCIDDKLLQVQRNPATETLAGAIVDSCVNEIPINIIAHSQGAIITSGALRVALTALFMIYSAQESTAHPRNVFQFLKDISIIGQIERFNQIRRIDRKVRSTMEQYISVQTFGGAATWYPDGPLYRHVYNTNGLFSGDPVAKPFGQGNIFAHPGSGATVERLHRGGRGLGNHSIDENYLQTSNNYVNDNEIVRDPGYVPIHLNMLR